MVKMVFCPDLVNPEDFNDPKAARRIRLTRLGESEMVRRSDGPLERGIQSRILKALNKDPDTIMRCRSADAAGHITGDPDLYGTIGGYHVEWEVKVPGEEPTKIQYVRLAQWAKAGAWVGWGTSVAQALAFQQKVLASASDHAILGSRPGVE